MLEFKIYELLSTVAVGLATIISIIYFYFLALRLFNRKKFNEDAFIGWFNEVLKREYRQTGYVLAISIMVFSTGLLVEDFTDHLVDTEHSQNFIVKHLKRIEVNGYKLFKTEGELRYESLINQNGKTNSLGRDIFNSAKIADDKELIKGYIDYKRMLGENLDSFNFWEQYGELIHNNNVLKDIFIKKYVNGVYYTAKNWCYLNSASTREELSQIQNRIDLSRSIRLIAFSCIIVLILMNILYISREISRGKKKRFTVIMEKEEGTVEVKRPFYPILSFPILIVAFWVTGVSYEIAEKNFNERAFGYYVSHFKYEK